MVELSGLPAWPYALSEPLAAAFCSISVNTFRRMVDAKTAPAPTWITEGRKVWLRPALEEWLDRVAGRGASQEIEDEWSRPRGKGRVALSGDLPRSR